MAAPHLIFGCATIGHSFTQASEVSTLLDILKSAGIKRLDTAARYPPTAPGLSQKLLGEAEAAEKGFAIDTKIKVVGSSEGSLTAPAIEESLSGSLASLHLSDVISSGLRILLFCIDQYSIGRGSLLPCS